MNGVVSASNSSLIFFSCINQPKTLQSRGSHCRLCPVVANSRIRTVLPNTLIKFRGSRGYESTQRSTFRCSSNRPGAPGPGENESKAVLDAFFLGKALAEVINERVESAVGEVLGTIGRLQAEQQKQVQEIQEQVLERAKRAKEKAAREAMETQGLAPNPSTTNSTSVTSVSSAGSSVSINNAAAYTNLNSSSLSERSSNGPERKLGPADEDTASGDSNDEWN